MSLVYCALRRFALLALIATIVVSPASGQTVELSLNLFYTNPIDDQSGGNWQVVAKSTNSFGISALDLYLAGIVAPNLTPVGPRGTVNGTDPAGFSVMQVVDFGGFVNIIPGQSLVPQPLPPGKEQSVFYGVGTLAGGEPNTVGGSGNSIGPALATLTDPAAIPWATGDAFGDANWDTAAILASGIFQAGSIPSFHTQGAIESTGSVFTTLGTLTEIGATVVDDNVTTVVRDNLVEAASPDYNGNGVVDAADYAVWRSSFGQTGPGLPADGNRNEIIDQFDYDHWKAHFGEVVTGSGSGSLAGPSIGSAVPEPTTAGLLAGLLGATLFWRKHRVFGVRMVK